MLLLAICARAWVTIEVVCWKSWGNYGHKFALHPDFGRNRSKNFTFKKPLITTTPTQSLGLMFFPKALSLIIWTLPSYSFSNSSYKQPLYFSVTGCQLSTNAKRQKKLQNMRLLIVIFCCFVSAFCSQNQQVCDIKKDKINCDGEKKPGKSEYIVCTSTYLNFFFFFFFETMK